MTSRSAGLLALAAALLCAPAHAQVGEKLSAVQASPLLEGRVPGASGRLTLSGGTTADLRQRGGYLTGVTLRVPVAQPARAAALRVKGGGVQRDFLSVTGLPITGLHRGGKGQARAVLVVQRPGGRGTFGCRGGHRVARA